MKKFAVIFVMTLLLAVSSNAYAAEGMWETQNVALDKTWTIQFSEAVDVTTVTNENVYIIDESNEKQESIVTLSDSNKIEITPILHGYIPSNVYTLVINNIKSEDGQNLKKAIQMNFEVESWYSGELSYSEYLSLKTEVQTKIKNLKMLYPIGNLSDYEYSKQLQQSMLAAEKLQNRVAELANVGDYEGKKELKLAKEQLTQVNSEIENLIVARKAQLKFRSYENVLIEYRFLYERDNNHSIIDKKITEIERSFPIGNYSKYEYEKQSKALMTDISKAYQNVSLYGNAKTYYEKKMKKQYEDELSALESGLDELRTSWSAQVQIHSLEGQRN